MDKNTSSQAALDELRGRIDALDDGLHDLLIERAAIVEQVARLKRGDSVPPFRPGREAQMLRRLVGRHRGTFPRAAMVRLWREILGGSVAMQTELKLAVAGPCGEVARDHFGSLAPMRAVESARDVIRAVCVGEASVGVLPLADKSDADPWWLALAALGDGRPRVIARLPFAAAGRPAFVIAMMEPEASGDDCTLYAIEGQADAAFEIVTQKGSARLVAVAGMFTADRPAAGLGPRATWLGAYARPLTE